MQMPRMRFSVRRLMAVVAVVAGIMGALVQLLKAVDAAIRCRAEHHLPVSLVRNMLGVLLRRTMVLFVGPRHATPLLRGEIARRSMGS